MDPTYVVEITLTDAMSKVLIQDITAQLKEILQDEVDDVMSEYVMMMLKNKKSMAEIQVSMIDFLGAEPSTRFVGWLSGHLKHHLGAHQMPPVIEEEEEEEPKPELRVVENHVITSELPSPSSEPPKPSPTSSRVVSLKSVKTSMQARKERWGIVESNSDHKPQKKDQGSNNKSQRRPEEDLRNLIGKKRHQREDHQGASGGGGDLRELLGRKKDRKVTRRNRSRSKSDDEDEQPSSSKPKSNDGNSHYPSSKSSESSKNGPPPNNMPPYPPFPYGMNPMQMQQHTAMMQQHPHGFHPRNFPYPRGPPPMMGHPYMGQPGFPPFGGFPYGGGFPNPHHPRGGPRGPTNHNFRPPPAVASSSSPVGGEAGASTTPRSFTNKSWVNPDTVMAEEEKSKETEDPSSAPASVSSEVTSTQPSSYYQPRYPRGGGGYYHQPRPRGRPRAPFANKKWVRPGTEPATVPTTTTKEQGKIRFLQHLSFYNRRFLIHGIH